MAQFEKPSTSTATEPLTRLPFPPVTKQHILNCSYHAWHPRYRKVTPKARLIPLPQPFLDYLRADGIVLPPDDDSAQRDWSDDDSGIFSSTENPDGGDDEDEEDADPSRAWPEVHETIKTTIAELGGKVVPKLNWSAPKDATWINATNSMECRTPSDIYLLLKSSDFVTHDLEHAFDDTDEGTDAAAPEPTIPYHLILRKQFQLNPSVEFRCFVRNRRVIAVSQRDLNHFDFLFPLASQMRARIQAFFDEHLRASFPDPNFVFDVYIPPPHEKAWLIDVNPWAQRTDPLLYSWLELLTMDGPEKWEERQKQKAGKGEEVVRLPLRPTQPDAQSSSSAGDAAPSAAADDEEDSDADTATPSDAEDAADEEIWTPEIRLVKKDDPEAYSFATPQYSAHKLPRDVVDASRGGEGAMREFAEKWKEILAKQQEADANYSSSDDGA